MDAGNSGARANSGSAGAAGKPEDNQALTEEALHLKRIQVCYPRLPGDLQGLTTTFQIYPSCSTKRDWKRHSEPAMGFSLFGVMLMQATQEKNRPRYQGGSTESAKR